MPSLRKMMLAAAPLVLVALIALPLAVGAQTANESIQLGDTVNGTLEAGHLSAQYVLSGNRGDVVTISLESDEIDGYLTLLDPGLNSIAEDDDSGGSSNPSIVDFTLPTTGDFTILVDSYNKLQTGDFSLSVTGTKAPESTVTPTGTSGGNSTQFKQDIAFGQSITTTITPDISAYAFNFEGSAGQRVTITLRSTDFDSYLALQDSSGAEIASDDDSAGNLNAEIQDFRLTADGTYTILAGSFGGGANGEFTLSLAEAGTPFIETTPLIQATPTLIPTPETSVTLPGAVTPISIGDTVNGTIDTFEGSKTYQFTGQSSQLVTISAESDAFDTYLQLIDADGHVLIEDDDSAGNLNAEIQEFALPADGTYTISVGSFSGAASGDFTLSISVQRIAPPTNTPAPTNTPRPTIEGTVFTSSPAAIQIGDTINGTLPDDTRAAIYTFTGSAGQPVTITLTSSDFDSYLSLRDSSGAELAFDDDSAGNQDARIANFELPDDGTYTIQATSLGSFDTGTFTLTLEGGTSAQPTAVVSNGGTISLNAEVNGTLAEGTPNAIYTFDGDAGQIVTFTLESDDFDAYLSLQGLDGTEIASDDDSAGNLNAQIQNFELPESGTYTLAVSGANDFSTGDYTLTAAATTSSVQPTATPLASPPGTISLDETVHSTLLQGPNAHTFAGTAGQVITIEVDSVDFDAYLQLKDSDDIELASDDDSAGNLNARIENFTLPADDTYVIIVSSFDNTATGEYTLTVSEGGGTVTPVPPTAVPSGSSIAVGDTVSGTLSGADLSASYTFQGDAGELVTITASSEDFDSYLRLLDSNDQELITDDDSAGNLDSRIAYYALPGSGTYTIVVESFDSAGGSYTLSLAAAEVQPIEYTQSINGELTEAQSTAGYRFTGSAGDVITITLRSSAFDAYLSLNEANSDSSYPLITDDDSAGGSDSRIGPYTLPSTGDYIITVSSYNSTVTGAYTLELDRAVLLPITFDQPVTAEITAENSTLYYSFEGKTGDVIDIEVDSGGSVDTSLSLTGPDSYQIISDDDSGRDFDPEISHLVLSSDGTYTIALGAYAEGDTGTVTLTLTRAPLRSLDDGPQEVRLNEKVTQDVLTFTGVAGEQYQLWVRLHDSVGSPNVTITQNGTSVATGSATTSTALLVAFIVPQDGQVTVQITDYSYAKVVMTVRVETVGE